MASTPETPRGMQPPDRKPVRITVPEGRKVRYGDPFWPKVPFQSIFYISAIFAVLLFLALTSPAPLQDPADPLNHAAIDPKPEWYFMFLFQLLKYFPGPFIVVGTAIIPTIVVLLLFALPFYDRNWARKVNRRPVAVASMSGAMLIIFFLTWGGFGFPTPNFSTSSQLAGGSAGSSGSSSGTASNAGAISSDVSAIFSAHCAACHIQQHFGGLNLANYAGLIQGGNVLSGPVVKPGNHTASYLWQIVQPKGPWPAGQRMPLGGPYLSDTQIKTIADWIDGLSKRSGATNTGAAGQSGANTSNSGGVAGGVSFKKDIQSIFTAHCAACHIQQQFGGLNLATYQGLVKGGNIVPGSVFKAGDHAHSVIWQIINPSGPYPGGQRMPLGGPYLDSTQIQTIASWIDQGAKNN